MRRVRLSFAVALGAGLLVLGGCGPAVRAPVGDRTVARPPAQATGSAEWHVVRRGESLYSIAWRYGQSYQTLARWNGIRAPYTIYPGQKLRVRAPQAASPPARRPPSRPQPPRSQPAPPPAKLVWQWPVEGPVLRRFDPRGSGKKGIAIGGKPGTPVRAAAPGRVVYSGGGLVGYGRLIIIKHDKNYLSAYGHNRKLMAHEGDQVRGGQVIAQMGSSGTDRTMLHFEIRKDGSPVDPLRLLPPR